MPVRVAQISDLHLDPDRPVAWTNLSLIRDALATRGADHLVVTGDLTDHGLDRPADLTAAQREVAALAQAAGCGDALIIPGNHDVGDFAGDGEQCITGTRVQRYLDTLGEDRFAVDAAAWRLIGINAMLLGSGLAREAEQDAWFEEQLERAAEMGLHAAVFSHTPWYLRALDETLGNAGRYWIPTKRAADRMLALIARWSVGLVASGHVHRTLVERGRAWCPPASGTLVDAAYFPAGPGWNQLGYLEHDLHEDGSVQTSLVELQLEGHVHRVE